VETERGSLCPSLLQEPDPWWVLDPHSTSLWGVWMGPEGSLVEP
jgi:hypothetical protein